jgi:hypothetical protein
VLPSLLLCGMVALTACSASGAQRATPTSTPRGPQPTKRVARAGDTGLCQVVSPAEFAGALGGSVTQVAAGTTSDLLTGLPEVYCTYVDTSDLQQVVGRGTINFEVATDAPTAAATFQTVKRAFGGVSDVQGVGADAFVGSPGGGNASGGTGLVVVQGSLLLYLSVGGDAQTVTRVTTQLATLVLRRVA